MVKKKNKGIKLKDCIIILILFIVIVIVSLIGLYIARIYMCRNYGDQRINRAVGYALIILLIVIFVYIYISNDSCVDSLEYCDSNTTSVLYIPIIILVLLKIYAYFKLEDKNRKGIDKVLRPIWSIIMAFSFILLFIYVVGKIISMSKDKYRSAKNII